MKRPIIIDCDPGADDALALFLANNLKELDIKAICTVNGNVEVEKTTRNARLLASLLNMDCPIAKGADSPIVKPIRKKSDTHGKDGISGCSWMLKDYKEKPLSEKNAVELMREILMESEEKITVVAVGPLTNIALLLKIYPEVKAKIKEFSIMGGGINNGNMTPCTEFNFYIDPEAAQIVMNSGVPITMVGINLTVQATIDDSTIEKIQKINNEKSKIAAGIMGGYIEKDPAMHDPCAILAITHPEIFEFEELYVQIDTREGLTRGMSYADYRPECTEKPNCKVAVKIDKEAFQKYILEAFK